MAALRRAWRLSSARRFRRRPGGHSSRSLGRPWRRRARQGAGVRLGPRRGLAEHSTDTGQIPLGDRHSVSLTVSSSLAIFEIHDFRIHDETPKFVGIWSFIQVSFSLYLPPFPKFGRDNNEKIT